jgi:hypothetical protein
VGVVFVPVDAFRLDVLLVVQSLAILLRKLAVVLSAHALLFLVDASFLTLQVRGLTGVELATGNTLANAILLDLFALVDGCRLGRDGQSGGAVVCAKSAVEESARVATRVRIFVFMGSLL